MLLHGHRDGSLNRWASGTFKGVFQIFDFAAQQYSGTEMIGRTAGEVIMF